MSKFIDLPLYPLYGEDTITLAKSHIEALRDGDGVAFATLVLTTSGKGYESTMSKADIITLVEEA